MLKKTLAVGMAMLVGVLAVTGVVISMSNVAFAKTFLCTNKTTCFGTDDDDVMTAITPDVSIVGFGGNDVITTNRVGIINLAQGGHGDDLMTGGTGRDQIEGDDGADKLAGAGGNDLIFANFPVNPTDPDGSKDMVDCGPGDNDEAFINVSVDHDTASGCETVHAG